MLSPKRIVTLIPRLVGPRLDTFAMLEVVFPLTFVHGSVHVLIYSWSVCLIVGPEAFVDVSVNVDELAFAMSPVIPPLSNILGAVSPQLLAVAVSKASLPLTIVDGPRLKLVGLPPLPRLVGIPLPLAGHGLARLFLSEVLAAAELVGPEHGSKAASRVAAPGCLQFDDQMGFGL